ncbi:6-phosphofructokinase [Dehalococcoidia bacterium]|nr:6-phosphofructokinase [Dehalococcoidia bacterium]MCL0090445.1 6-phosphofructokinase [Dehalococcoidia bacterium]
MKKIVISTGGGDAPGLNAVIYAVVKTSYLHGWEVYGSRFGYRGLLDRDELVRLLPETVQDIVSLGGTIIGTTNKGNPFELPIENYLIPPCQPPPMRWINCIPRLNPTSG